MISNTGSSSYMYSYSPVQSNVCPLSLTSKLWRQSSCALLFKLPPMTSYEDVITVLDVSNSMTKFCRRKKLVRETTMSSPLGLVGVERLLVFGCVPHHVNSRGLWLSPVTPLPPLVRPWPSLWVGYIEKNGIRLVCPMCALRRGGGSRTMSNFSMCLVTAPQLYNRQHRKTQILLNQ